MARGAVRVSITGDSSGLNRATRTAERDLTRLESTGRRAGQGLKTGFLAAGAAATAGLAAGLGASAKAAIEAEKSQAKLEAQLDAVNISYRKHAAQIDEVIQKHSKLAGIDDEELQGAFTSIVRATGDVDKALGLLTVTTDIARARNIDVAKAAEMVAKVYNGNVGVLKRMGIAFEPVTAAQDRLRATTKKATDEQVRAAKEADKQATSQSALALLQGKFAGQAEAYGKTTAGALDRAKVASENLGETVGAKLTPLLAGAADALVDVVGAAERNWPRLKQTVGTVTGAISGFIDDNRGDFNAMRDAVNNVATAVRAAIEGVVLPVVRRMLPGIKTAFSGAAETIKGAVRIITGVLTLDFKRAWDGVKTIFGGGLKTAAGVLRAGTAPIREAASKVGDAIGGGLKRGVGKAVEWLAARLQDLIDLYNATVGRITGQIGKSKFKSPLGSIEDFAAQIQGAGSGIPAGKKATGGLIGSMAGPRGDRVPILAEEGEYVIRRRVVERFGPTFFAALNEELPRFAAGGMVTGDTDYLPALGQRLAAMAQATGKRIHVRSGRRTISEQARLYALWKAGKGNLAAPPNANAPHVRGVAADITPGRAAFGAIASQFGLAFTVGSEPWHIELRGSPRPSAMRKATPKKKKKKKGLGIDKDEGTGFVPGAIFGSDQTFGIPADTSFTPTELMEPPPGPTFEDWNTANQALAALTPDEADDLHYAREIIPWLEDRLAEATAAGDPAAIADWAGKLRGARDRLADLSRGPDPTPDLQAQLEQQKAKTAVAERKAALQGGFISTMQGLGDLGSGIVLVQNNQMLHPADPNVMREVGRAAAAGFSYQGYVSSSREAVL